jgi:cysteine desulfurase/selenocysteine lyase
MEHHSNIVPWQMLCEEKGANAEGRADRRSRANSTSTSFEKLLHRAHEDRVAHHVSNALGTSTRSPNHRQGARRRCRCSSTARRPCRTCRRRAGARLRLLRVLRSQDLRPDGHRRAVRQARAARGDAALQGRRRHDPLGDFEKTTYNTLPHKFEAGTPHIAGVIGLGAALDWVSDRSGRDRGPRARAARVRHEAVAASAACASSARRARRRGAVVHVGAPIRTTSARCSTRKASRSAPATTARSR